MGRRVGVNQQKLIVSGYFVFSDFTRAFCNF